MISVIRDICCYLLIPASVQSVKSDVLNFTTEDTNFHKNIWVTIFRVFRVFRCLYTLAAVTTQPPLKAAFGRHPVQNRPMRREPMARLLLQQLRLHA